MQVSIRSWPISDFFFFNDTATTEIYTLSLHDALPISARAGWSRSAPPSATARWRRPVPRKSSTHCSRPRRAGRSSPAPPRPAPGERSARQARLSPWRRFSAAAHSAPLRGARRRPRNRGNAPARSRRRHAGDALAEALLGESPRESLVLETSAELRERQRARLGNRVQFIDRLPPRLAGAVIANEVVDAMPVHAVAWTGRGIMERGVSLRDGKLVWAEKPASGELLEEARAIKVPTPYQSEIGLAARAWMRTLGERLAEGPIFVIDYGFPRHEYYHPQRATGTLMCHYRHQAHGDPFLHPGEQDVSAHVDFSALADAARDAGLEVLGYATQAQFLVNCGITEVLGEANVESALH